MSRNIIKAALMAAPLAIAVNIANAEGKFTVTPMLSYQTFDNILKTDGAAQIALGYCFGNNFGAELLYNQGTAGLVDSAGNRFTDHDGLKNDGTADYKQYRLDGLYFIPMTEKTRWQPYLAAGIGEINIKEDTVRNQIDSDGKGDYYQLNVGGGLQYSVTPSLNLRFDGRYLSWDMGKGATRDNVDDFQFASGLNFVLGANEVAPEPQVIVKEAAPATVIKDSDADGVIDQLDKCPGTAANVRVGTRGCALDTDNDGVVDGIDRCPTSPAGADVDATGCTKVVETPVVVEPVYVAPVVEAPVCESTTQTLAGVNFKSGSANLTTAAKRVLDTVVAELANTYGSIEVQAHTDSQGDEAMNQALSDRRAQSVADYLTAHGIDSYRISAYGLGEMSPIDTNATAAGRKNNRRVELITQTSCQ